MRQTLILSTIATLTRRSSRSFISTTWATLPGAKTATCTSLSTSSIMEASQHNKQDRKKYDIDNKTQPVLPKRSMTFYLLKFPLELAPRQGVYTSIIYMCLKYAPRVYFTITCRGCARPEWDMAGAHSFHIRKKVLTC